MHENVRKIPENARKMLGFWPCDPLLGGCVCLLLSRTFEKDIIFKAFKLLIASFDAHSKYKTLDRGVLEFFLTLKRKKHFVVP